MPRLLRADAPDAVSERRAACFIALCMLNARFCGDFVYRFHIDKGAVFVL